MSCCSVPVTKPRLLALVLAALSAQSAWAASGSCAGLAAMPAAVEIDQGIQQEVRSPVAITRIAVGDPKIADVHVNGTDGFLLTGVAQGTTSLMVWTACATAPRQSMVFVRGRATASMVETVPAPSADAELPSQVQTDIRFIEVSRTKLKQAGTSIFGKGSNNFLFGAPGTVPGVTVTPGTVSGALPSIPLAESAFNIVWGGGSSKVLGILNALENSGFAYTLARPSLVALSGQSASFLAGGEFPVPVPNTEGNGISIEYKEFGVRLTLTPTVVGRNRILLKVAPEVSELDFTSEISIAGTTVPIIRTRRTDTSIALADGESFVVSGLINTSNISTVEKFPGLGDIPILGAFFRSSKIQRDERELLMIVTPHLVQPLAANAQLPSLPGEGLRTYDPSFPRLYFLENGDFDRRDGLSK
ncbi:type II and III secretion system protein family protein [Pseudomonas savastanoi]|nr:type II and III secretion system protein family protein [Pseudomonas savastanoi]EFW78823.1 type II/III secretion system protein [Pseudomonas savastanoi pv. glycinea str. B076]EFW86464.1 type II/III secretion system protein [Pseudomonas savastanoi pv. glycinea str. race 4]MCQ3004445.1 type II and III secretion system protein family protein [Pseudomonas savastanoi]PYD25501.1 type II and III secretion system protein family protein [Pseudomonas savastanoi pv. glycinea]